MHELKQHIEDLFLFHDPSGLTTNTTTSDWISC